MKTNTKRNWKQIATAAVLTSCNLLLGCGFQHATSAYASPIQWQALNEPGCGGWITSVAVSPHDPQRVLIGGDMLGVGLSVDQGNSWQITSGFLSWEIADFTWHPTNPNIVWAGTMSGPYLSTDGGQTWQEKRQGMPTVSSSHYSAPIQKILFDPNNSNRLLAFGGNHRRWSSPGQPLWGEVWESNDGGNNWYSIGTISKPDSSKSNIMSAAFAAGSSSVVYVVGDGVGVLVSNDGGHTWQTRNNGLPHTVMNDLVAHPTLSSTLWVALGNYRAPGSPPNTPFTSGGIYKSADGGNSWQAVQGLGGQTNTSTDLTARYRALAVSPSDPTKLITSDAAWNTAGIYKSSNGGNNWQVITTRNQISTPMPSSLNMTVAEFAPQNANIAFMAGAEFMLRTTDGGQSWVDITAKPVAGQNNLWQGRGYQGWVCNNFKFNPQDSQQSVLLAWDHGNFWQSSDGMQTWKWGGTNFPVWNGASDIAFVGAQTMYVTLGQNGSFAGIARTTNKGQSWEILA